MALVVHQGAIAMRPPGVVSVGLHALGFCGVDGVAMQYNMIPYDVFAREYGAAMLCLPTLGDTP